jgi:hypothetical protein
MYVPWVPVIPYWKMRPRPLPARYRLLNLPAATWPGGFGAGPAAIEPGLLFFAHGNPIGGPSELYRGVSASTFPLYASVLGPGAPMAASPLGIAGARIGSPGLRGEPFP